jgi:hypothetical protein
MLQARWESTDRRPYRYSTLGFELKLLCPMMHNGKRPFRGMHPNTHKERLIMPIINLLVVLIVVGVLLWLVNNYIPMAGSIKRILNIVVVIVVVLWLLNAFGILNSLSNLRV